MGDDPHFRRSARQPLELGVRFRRDADDAPFESSGRLVDLGMGGAQILCHRPPPIGTPVRIELSAPSAWDPLDLEARVRWVDDGDGTFGVEFGSLRPEEATALYQMLAVLRFDRDAGAPKARPNE